MKKVIITKGLPASGKSTWAKEQLTKNPGCYKRISKDELRMMLDNHKSSLGNEQFILKVRDMLILQTLTEGYHVIIDDTNLHPKHEATIRNLVKGQAIVQIQDFTDVSLELCIERDRRRPNYVGEQVIRQMYRDFLQPSPQMVAYISDLPDAIIVDLDGTLAMMNGRNPYNTSKCEQDTPNEVVEMIIKLCWKAGLRILVTSGRENQYREKTINWLVKYEIHFDLILMRGTGDYRKDAIIKQELYEQNIAGKYNVRFVLDDRNQVVDLWRSLGLICLQVAAGDY